MELEPIFISAIVFGFSYAVIFLLVRKKERMAMLEKGVDPAIFQQAVVKGRNTSTAALKYGLLFIGVALGIFLGSLLDEMTTLNDQASYFSMIFLFGGIGLVVAHFLEKKELKEEMGN